MAENHFKRLFTFVVGNTLNKNTTCDHQTGGSGEAGPTNPWHNSGAVCVTKIIAADKAVVF